MSRTRLVCLALIGLLPPSAAVGSALTEIEPNDTVAAAQALPGSALPVGALEGRLGPDGTASGIDFFSFPVSAPFPLVTASLWDYTPDAADNDSVLGVFSSFGFLTEFDNDNNPGLLSSIHFYPSTDGQWAVAATGEGDFFFEGQGHSEQFDYRLVVSTGATALEQGSNDTLATAQAIPASAFNHGAASVEGSLGPDSTADGIDFYSIQAAAGTLVTASVFDFTPFPEDDTDGLLAVYGPDGSLLGYDDVDGVDFLPAIHFIAPQTGTYTFALTGYGDWDFDGVGHPEAFDYRLVVSVPEPGTFLLLLPLGLAMARSHRRR
ncbi:MAG TPA: hypothetical protein VM243_12685 [Phycisphaerae bacterium]|nr:hypothetical protein [Phycisphaerae bacterium]